MTEPVSAAGSFSFRQLGQAVIFHVPHLLVLRIMPEIWGILPIIFASSLFLGWVRIRSGSIIGPWLIHASANCRDMSDGSHPQGLLNTTFPAC